MLTAQPTAAQTSRAGAIAAEQAAKASDLHPRRAPTAERVVIRLEEELIDTPAGVYPYIASVYSGGGFTLGVGYRRYFGDDTHWDAKVLGSVKGYTAVELTTDSWNHAGRRLDLHGRVGRRDATRVAFHGLGIGSPDEAVPFGLTQTYAGGDVVVRPVRFLRLRAGTAYEDFDVDADGDTDLSRVLLEPSPGDDLRRDAAYLHSVVSAGFDSRPAAGYARRGGLYEVRYHRFDGVGDRETFGRLDGEVVQHLPLVREQWVISLRGRIETLLDDAASVPVFLLSSLGGGDTLRGYPSWRFRDRHAALTTAEFRWVPNRNAMDVALFYDAGTMARRRRDLRLRELKRDVGIGVRFHSPSATPLRIEVARGSEGVRLVFAGSAAF